VAANDEWGRLTRFLESARLAFARKRGLWASSASRTQTRYGMVVTVTGLDGDGGALFRLQSPLLHADRLAPLFGPSWTTYAPDG
jgi:hypothetical protein